MPNQFFSPEGDLEDYFVDEYWLIDQYIGDQLWIWGSGTNWKLGNNIDVNRTTPVTTSAGGTNWKQVSCGYRHTSAIKTDGTLWVWGNNYSRQLGLNTDTSSKLTPVTTFAGGTNWKQVNTSTSANESAVAAIKTDGTLWTWGGGVFNQLGNADITNRSTPVTTFAGGTNWKQVTSGGSITAAIKTDGTLWVWGTGGSGQLGNGTTTPGRSTPITTFAGGNNWKEVSAGSSGGAIGAIKTDGTLWVWGVGNSGELGNNAVFLTNSTPVTTFAGGTNWKQISVGGPFMVAIKTDGTLWVWGTGGSGQLGNANTTSRSTPVTTFAGGTNWKQVSAGNQHIAAIKTDGTLWTWGNGDSGRLGNGVTVGNISTPVTTFAGGTNWKQVDCDFNHTAAVQSGINADYPLS